ncbi:MAG: putative amidophosphoribosyltransferase [Nitrospinales bacterium]|jgi:predicted amidophosphoribosyltransferase
MMFCPECEEEFPDTTPTCSDCNVKLVSSLKEEEFPELAVICTIINEATAYIIRGFLENENIPCQLENISFHAGPAPVADLMKVRLWAKKKDVGRARKLLEERQGIQVCSDCGTEVAPEDDVCSHCGEKLN